MTGHMAGYEGEEKEDRGGAEQMMERIVILLTILIGGGISLVLLMGKGAFLIAGYNTASEKEKRKYNEKKTVQDHRNLSGPDHSPGPGG